MSSSIAARSIRSVSWTALSQVIFVGIGFVRSIILARLLNVDTFGIYAAATSIVAIATTLTTFGMTQALLRRVEATEDEDKVAAVYATLQGIFAIFFLAVMLPISLFFFSGDLRTALVVASCTTILELFAWIGAAVHQRRVQHRRIALVGSINIVVTSLVCVALAWMGWEIWALLTGDIVAAVLLLAGMLVIRPIWRFHFGWDRSIARHLLTFGFPVMSTHLLEAALQRFDDIFVQARLGATQLGYYSRAFTFANYPRTIVAAPITYVTGGAFAEVSNRRRTLSQGFFRSVALIVRLSMLVSIWLVLVAPEIVHILLGDRWLPMVPILRVFALYAILDPLRDVLGGIFLAVGEPRTLLIVRVMQLGTLIVGMVALIGYWGASGVAVASTLAVALGVVVLSILVRKHVDFSLTRLWGAPVLAAALGLLATWGLLTLLPADANPWTTAFAKSGAYVALYCGVLFLIERNDAISMARRLWRGTLKPA